MGKIFDTQIGSAFNVTTTLAEYGKYIKENAIQGPAGPAGPAGPQGPEGPSGATGPQGPEGRAGLALSISATVYSNSSELPPFDSVEVSQGFLVVNGTTYDLYYKGVGGTNYSRVYNWGGIEGPQGPTGPTGPQGPIGPAGPTGPQGPAGPIGNFVYPTGSVYITISNTFDPNIHFEGYPASYKADGVAPKWALVGTNRVLWSTTNTNSMAGTYLNQQLPNIRGEFETWMSGSDKSTGAFTTGSDIQSIGLPVGSASKRKYINFNADNGTGQSSTIYVDGGVVRPAAYTVFMWVKTVD